MTNGKITEIKNPEKDKLQAAVEALKRTLPTLIENASLVAQLRKASYDAHIRQGFTAEQALELCKNT